MSKKSEKHLQYYQREMAFLRDMGQIFAQKHPKVAKRLGLSASHASDPQVERLMEGFAFLTSYIQQDIDSQLPRLSSAILSTIYPALTEPMPSMGVVQCQMNYKQKMSQPASVNKGSVFFCHSLNDRMVRCRAMDDSLLHPLEIEEIDVVSIRNHPNLLPYYKHHTALHIKYRCVSDAPVSVLDGPVRFYISSVRSQALPLYSYIMRAQNGVSFAKNDDEFVYHPNCKVQPVGLDNAPDHGVHSGYALLRQYFAMPERFLFFDLNIPVEMRAQKGSILLPLTTEGSLSAFNINRQTFRLNCVPIENVFEKTSDPITLDHKKVEYKVVADRRHEDSTEVYAVRDVYVARSVEEKERLVAPYFSYHYQNFLDGANIFWYARRVPAQQYLGSEVYLSFVDRNAESANPKQETVYVRTLCTNRYYASDIAEGTPFFTEAPLPVTQVVSLLEMTEPMYAFEQDDQWKLVSMLATSYLSLMDKDDGAERLRNLLELLAMRNAQEAQSEIMGIKHMTVESCVKRSAARSEWAGLRHGHKVTIMIDEHYAQADSLYLLLTLLNLFLSTQTHIHTFVELSVQSNAREGVWHKWPLKNGSAATM